MRKAMIWTPLLRDHRDRNDIRDANDGKSEYFDPADPTAFRALPRERSADDAEGIHHPLTLPRVKQRPRRARSSTTSIRSADTAKQGGSATPQGLSSTGDLSALVSDEGGVNVNGTDLDIFGGVFGRASGVQNSSARGDGASVVVNDPLFSSSASSLALDPLGVGPTGGVGASGEKMAAVAVSKKDVKVAEAGLSDDPLTLMMEARAMAKNMSRQGGTLLDGDLATASRSGGSDVGGGVTNGGGVGGGRSSLKERDGRTGSVAESIARGGSFGKKGGGDGEGGGGGSREGGGGPGWGKRWETHREGILKEFGAEADRKGGDQAAGPATAAGLSSSSVAAVRGVAPSKSRFDARLEELERASSGGKSGGGGGGGGGGGNADGKDAGGGNSSSGSSGRARNVAGVAMAGGLLLTPAEYTAHVKALKGELEEAWAKEEKVAALKITVQAAKLLADVAVPTFYPALFAMVAGLLEAFGVMVFERIRSRAEDSGEDHGRPGSPPPPSPLPRREKGETPILPEPPARHPLPRGWTCEDVGAEARETCRNWFYKTACIRELLPRILVEAALLPCYRFLAAENEFGQILGRLSTLVRGVGDPMVAVYCRCFISAAGAKIAPRETAHAVASLQDYLFSLQEIQLGKLSDYLRGNGLGTSDYLHLHSCAVDWLLGIVAPSAPRAVFTTILAHYRNHCGSLELLRLILHHFSPEHYAPFALEMALLIKQGHGEPSACTAAEVMALLGRRLGTMPPTGPDAVPLLNEAWQEIAPAPLEVYMEGAAAWLAVILLSPAYGPDEAAILVEDVACRIEGASPAELAKVQTHLGEGIVGALSAAGDEAALEAAGAHAVKILSVLDKARRAQACMDLLEAFLVRVRAADHLSPEEKRHSHNSLSSPSSSPSLQSPPESGVDDGVDNTEGCANFSGAGLGGGLQLERTLVGVAKLLHDSLDLLTGGERQRQQAAALTCDLVHRVGRGWKPDARRFDGGGGADESGGTSECSRLAILAECRQAFWGMDEVTDCLVLAATGLAVRAWQSGLDATARAALCFCSLTVPSVPSAPQRLALLQLCANAALQIRKPALADALFRSAICVVPECSPLVVSGALDPRAVSGSARSLSPSSPDFKSPLGFSARAAASAVEDVWGTGASPFATGGLGRVGSSSSGGSGGVGGFGGGVVGGVAIGGRKEHAGAWLLAGVVQSLLGALVAAPGHADLGPFYLLRGLLKAVRRLPWPAGSGLLASLYITAAGCLCAMWQKRLPYSVGTTSSALGAEESAEETATATATEAETTAFAAADGASAVEDNVGSSTRHIAPEVADAGAGGGNGNGEDGDSDGDSDGKSDGNGPSKDEGHEVDNTAQETAATTAAAAATAAATDDDDDDDGRADSPDADVRDGGEDGSSADKSERKSEDGRDSPEPDNPDLVGGGAADDAAKRGKDRSGEDKEDKRTWLDVGGVLGTDDLYLRNSAYLAEVQQLLGDMIMATLRELEELWEQGEAEMASVAGGVQARSSRLRYAQLALDLANQLVSNVRMEDGAASVVTFLIEAAARGGARDGSSGSIGMSAVGSRRSKGGGYFEHTVEFVAGVAHTGLGRARDAHRRMGASSETEEQEEACLTLLQGLSGFTRSA